MSLTIREERASHAAEKNRSGVGHPPPPVRSFVVVVASPRYTHNYVGIASRFLGRYSTVARSVRRRRDNGWNIIGGQNRMFPRKNDEKIYSGAAYTAVRSCAKP